jgi:hypothetical protein
MAILDTSKGTARGTGSAVLSSLTIPAGSSIIVCLGRKVDEGNASTVVYNDGATNYDLTAAVDSVGDNRVVGIFYLDNVAGTSNGTITVTDGGDNDLVSFTVYSVTGLVSTGSFDKQASAHARSTAPNSGNTATTSQADELVVGSIAPSQTAIVSWDGTVTDNVQTADNGNGSIRSATKIVSSTGTYNCAATTEKVYWGAAVATFKAASATGTNMKINIGDTFKTVDSLKINIGDVWKSVTQVKLNVGDTWKTVF